MTALIVAAVGAFAVFAYTQKSTLFQGVVNLSAKPDLSVTINDIKKTTTGIKLVYTVENVGEVAVPKGTSYQMNVSVNGNNVLSRTAAGAAEFPGGRKAQYTVQFQKADMTKDDKVMVSLGNFTDAHNANNSATQTPATDSGF